MMLYDRSDHMLPMEQRNKNHKFIDMISLDLECGNKFQVYLKGCRFETLFGLLNNFIFHICGLYSQKESIILEIWNLWQIMTCVNFML